MKKIVLALVVAIITVVSASSAQFTFDAGYGMLVTTEEAPLNESQTEEIVKHGQRVVDKDGNITYYVYVEEDGNFYEYTVFVSEAEDNIISEESKRKMYTRRNFHLPLHKHNM